MDYIKEAKYELILGLKNDESEDVISVLQQYYNDLVNIVKSSETKSLKFESKPSTKFILNVYISYVDDSESKEQVHKYFFSNPESLIDFYENNKSRLDKKRLTVDYIEFVNSVEMSSSSQEISFNLWREYIKK